MKKLLLLAFIFSCSPLPAQLATQTNVNALIRTYFPQFTNRAYRGVISYTNGPVTNNIYATNYNFWNDLRFQELVLQALLGLGITNR